MRYRSWLFLILAGVIVTSTGCASPTASKPSATGMNGPSNARNQVAGVNLESRPSGTPGSAAEAPPEPHHRLPGAPGSALGRTSGSNRNVTLADSIANLVQQLPGVTRAAAVVSGRVVLVGIRMRTQPQSAPVSLRRAVRGTVLQQMPQVRYVYVTADPPQVKTIADIADGVRKGIPQSSYYGRIAGLIRSMTPVV